MLSWVSCYSNRPNKSIQRNDSIGMSKRSYIEAVLEGLRSVSSSSLDINLSSNDPAKCVAGTKKIYVRLLLSIDRRESTAAAMETVCFQEFVLQYFQICILKSP